MLEPLDRILPLPYPHFMGFAPLDTWLRLLTQDRALAKIPPRYYPRLAAAIFTSTIGTAITLPERLALAAFLPKSQIPNPKSQIVFILGYYRSGTTHLHYLLSCDPNLATPRWYQMLAPQGFALSWTFLRYFLVPFLSSKRPQDDVAYGPEYPAEDDFGICNLSAACAMPGRMVVPNNWNYYARFNALEGLTEQELTRFRKAQLAITWKLFKLNRNRALLLKTPSHTARVAELARLYPHAKFIHLHRDPEPVLKSNIAMHRRFAPFLLQPHPGDDEIRRRVIAEYDHTERTFLAQSAALPPDRLIKLRYEDLIADPMGQLRAAYAQLNLPITPQFESQAHAYLESVRNYRTASDQPSRAAGSPAAGNRPEPPRTPELAWMHEAFAHNRPPLPISLPLPPSPLPLPPSTHPTFLTGSTAALTTAAFCFAAWICIAAATRNRFDFLAWPTGVAIGLSALKAAGANNKRGTTALGLWSLFLTLLVILGAAYPATWLAVRDHFSPDRFAYNVWLATYRGVLATNNFIWLLLGLTSAYRYASRKHIRPPGL